MTAIARAVAGLLLMLAPALSAAQDERPSAGAPDDASHEVPADSTGALGDPTAPADSTAVSPEDRPSDGAVPDSLALGLPPGFAPRDAVDRPFLRPDPSARRPDTSPLTPFDAFLLPPDGPARFFDRADLRLTGPTEWGDLAYLVPGLFTLRPGYPGTVTPFSFRAHGPEGTMIFHDGRPLTGGYTPVENPAPVGRGPLAGAAVMRVGASHLYGPGAGAGALQLMPVDAAPRQAFSEAATMTGIFGQRSGSFTTAFRWSQVGVLVGYAGAAANPWSLFDGYRAERAYGRLDWESGATRISATARTRDEKLKHFERLEKRGDDGHELTLAGEHRTGAWLLAARGIRHESTIRADGPSGFSFQDLERWEGELLLRRALGERGSVGVLGGVYRDRRQRRDAFAREETRFATGGHVLGRLRAEASGVLLDAAVRADHLATGHDALAAGVTASRPLGTRGVAWLHAARTVDRPVFPSFVSDAYTQADQGIDRPWPDGRALPAGETVAAGLRVGLRRLTVELGASADRYERQWAFIPRPTDGPLALDEPTAVRTERIRTVGGWSDLSLGPIWLGRILGSFACGGSVFASSTPEIRRLQVEPNLYGTLWGRLRKDLFQGALRLEGEVDWEALGEMPTIYRDLPPQSQLTARITARIGDAIVYYRAENVLNQEFLTSAHDEELGFVKLTSQNVIVGVSWILLD